MFVVRLRRRLNRALECSRGRVRWLRAIEPGQASSAPSFGRVYLIFTFLSNYFHIVGAREKRLQPRFRIFLLPAQLT
jgi:hypothetical protein